MKFTNKILDIVTTAIMKKVERKKEKFKDTEEYREILNKIKEDKNYEELLALHLACINKFKAQEDARNLANEASDGFKKAMKAAGFDLGWTSVSMDTTDLEHRFSKLVALECDFPTKEEIQTAIIFANDSDIKAVEEAVSTQFNL